ncbi:MAG TPA: hypothetical protein VI997_07670, partial [Candidatus Thermoplasmatota archaeon]|nr:hypothetical protein [Candidatus Thermoplasmatota archaeon]
MHPSPRLLLALGTVALAAAGVALPLSLAGVFPFAPFVLGLLAAWWALTSGGLLLFYLPAFAKREPPVALAWALLAAAIPAVAFPLAGAAWGALAFTWGALGLVTSLAGRRIGERVPLHRGMHPYASVDRAAAAAAVASFLVAAAAGAGLAAFALGPSALPLSAALVLGPPALLGVAGVAHVLPRAAKDPRLARGAKVATALLLAAAIVAATPA